MLVQTKICRRFTILVALALPGVSAAADIELGLGAGVGIDLPDAVSKEHTSFGPGPGLVVPLKIGLTDYASLRITGRADVAFGTDRVSWAVQVDGAPARLYSDGHWAMLAGAALTAGPEIVFPVEGAIRPYLGVEAGPTWVATYHSFSGTTQLLLDPSENDLTDPNNIDPFTAQLGLLTDAHVGISTGDAVGLWSEVGYSVAWVQAASLNKSAAGLDARREAFGWNALRLGLGVRFSL
ncbi:MAG: hypothetical protein GWP91_05865 [Rhodobacterales bacterium]|nr:hypothetical protein [Rhodobacterales bacterium]